MSAPDPDTAFAERLRQNDAQAMERFLNRMLPGVIQALRERFGVVVGGRTPEDFAQSIARTVFRRLREADKLPETTDDEGFENWLVRVAHNKVLDALRHKQCEEKYVSRISRLLEAGQADEGCDIKTILVRDLVDAMQNSLRDDVERTVFRGKLEGLDDATIGFQIKRTPRTVRTTWRELRERLAATFGRMLE
jgi:RNA polymerase sigma factor (sigma-70 family)